MKDFSTTAIMLKRISYGEADLIVTLFTLEKGKIPVIAKYAKKSKKRFPGILELFSVLNVVLSRGRGLPILKEAVLEQPYVNIRSDIKKTAYACYWAELLNEWMEEEKKQEPLFDLFNHVLQKLNDGGMDEEMLSILFQLRFADACGFRPNLSNCSVCGGAADSIPGTGLCFDLSMGGLVCCGAPKGPGKRISLSKGSAKQLLWLLKSDLNKAGRIRFSPGAVTESLSFLEAFVPYHLGKTPRSLKFLRSIRL